MDVASIGTNAGTPDDDAFTSIVLDPGKPNANGTLEAATSCPRLRAPPRAPQRLSGTLEATVVLDK